MTQCPKWTETMSTISKKFIRLDQTTRMQVLDIGDKQIFVHVETDSGKPEQRAQGPAREAQSPR